MITWKAPVAGADSTGPFMSWFGNNGKYEIRKRTDSEMFCGMVTVGATAANVGYSMFVEPGVRYNTLGMAMSACHKHYTCSTPIIRNIGFNSCPSTNTPATVDTLRKNLNASRAVLESALSAEVQKDFADRLAKSESRSFAALLSRKHPGVSVRAAGTSPGRLTWTEWQQLYMNLINTSQEPVAALERMKVAAPAMSSRDIADVLEDMFLVRCSLCAFWTPTTNLTKGCCFDCAEYSGFSRNYKETATDA